MLWFKKQKVHEPFKSDNWNLVKITNLTIDHDLVTLTVPDNCYWDLIVLSLIHTGMWNPKCWIEIYLKSGDLVLWSVGFPESLFHGRATNVTVAQGLGYSADGTDHAFKTGSIPTPCYLLPGEKLHVFQLPFDSDMLWANPVATVREWRIY